MFPHWPLFILVTSLVPRLQCSRSRAWEPGNEAILWLDMDMIYKQTGSILYTCKSVKLSKLLSDGVHRSGYFCENKFVGVTNDNWFWCAKTIMPCLMLKLLHFSYLYRQVCVPFYQQEGAILCSVQSGWRQAELVCGGVLRQEDLYCELMVRGWNLMLPTPCTTQQCLFRGL